MRPIKFRGKTPSGKWIYGHYITREEESPVVETSASRAAHFVIGADFNGLNLEEVLPETLGQYTGLYDMNGTDIYEGDIIRYNEHMGYLQPEFYAEVVFKNGAFGYRRKNSMLGGIEVFEPFTEHDCLKEDFLSYVEVVGNVYENKDLLER